MEHATCCASPTDAWCSGNRHPGCALNQRWSRPPCPPILDAGTAESRRRGRRLSRPAGPLMRQRRPFNAHAQAIFDPRQGMRIDGKNRSRPCQQGNMEANGSEVAKVRADRGQSDFYSAPGQRRKLGIENGRQLGHSRAGPRAGPSKGLALLALAVAMVGAEPSSRVGDATPALCLTLNEPLIRSPHHAASVSMT
jgi:hypothetical protein